MFLRFNDDLRQDFTNYFTKYKRTDCVLRQNNYSGVKKSTPPSKSAEDHLQESGTDSEKTKLKLFLFNGDANFSGIETDAQSVKERYVFF